MAETMPRSELDVDRLYYSIPTKQWFSTPDGVGCHYYESRADGLEQTGFDERAVTFLTVPLSDF